METKHKFRSYDGTALEGTLARPKDAAGTVVLLVHGITSSRDELGLFSGFADHLALAGVASFRFDYRCHGASKQPIESMTLAGIVNDIEAAAKYVLACIPDVRFHVVGMSFGGGLSAFWAATTAHAVSSVVMFAPVIDYEEDILGQHGLLANGATNDRVQRQLRQQGFVEVDGVRYGRGLLNELRYVNGIAGLLGLKCKSLIVHGDADSMVPFASSERFAGLNPMCRLVNIRGTDHGFGVPGDDDLSSPATKAKHREVFNLVSTFIEGAP